MCACPDASIGRLLLRAAESFHAVGENLGPDHLASGVHARQVQGAQSASGRLVVWRLAHCPPVEALLALVLRLQALRQPWPCVDLGERLRAQRETVKSIGTNRSPPSLRKT